MSPDVPGTPPRADDIARRLSQLSPAQRLLLERALAQRAGGPATPRSVASRDEITASGATTGPLAFNQELLFRLHLAAPDDVTYNVPRLLHISGQLEVDALRRALDTILARHAVFRTRFIDGPSGALQVVDPAAELPFDLVDVSSSPVTERDSAVERVIAECMRRPFDLASDVLLRATLVRIGPRAHRLLILSHHIVTDEGTRDVLFREIEILYRAAVTATPHSLDVPTVEFVDYARWQRRKAAEGGWDADTAFWKEQLREAAPLQLPADSRPRPYDGVAGARLSRPLPASVLDELHRTAQAHGVTPYMIVVALVTVLLARYTGSRDICVATPASGRVRPDLEGVAGYFTNTTLLRTRVDFDASFASLLGDVRRTVLESFEHSEVPLEHVLDAVGAPGLGAITNVGFVADSRGQSSAPAAPPRLDGADVTLIPTDLGASKFDLTIACTESDGLLRIGAEFRKSVFEPATVERMLEHFEVLITAALRDPESRVRDLPLLSPRERARIIDEWNATARPFRNTTLHELLAEVASASPAARAVVAPDATLTFAELEAGATRVARALRAHDVRPGDLVGVVMRRSAGLVVGLLGVLKAGAAYVPIDPAYPDARIADMLDDSGCRIVLADADLASKLPPAGATVLCVDAAGVEVADVADASDDAATSESLAYVIYTSGSTGRPKGAMIRHRGLVNYLAWAVEAYGARDGIGAPVHSSISFDLTVTALWVPLLAGRTAFMLPDGDGVDVLADFMRTHSGLSLVKLTPAHLALLAEALTPEEVRTCTRAFVIGGEPLLGETLAWWQQHAPGTVHVNEYGPTETVVGCCVEFVASDRRVGPVRIGRPIANTRLYVLDEWGQPTPIGVPGELYIGGDGVCAGYLGRAALTAERFVRDPFSPVDGARMYRSGDRARWCADGTLEYLGRLDEQVKIRGFRVELGEIEAAVAAVPGVAHAAAAVRGIGLDARIVAYFVGTGGAMEPSAIRAALASRLPAHMIPAHFVAVDAIPVTPNGKVDRKALLAIEIVDEPASDRGEIATDTEAAVAALWREILGCDAGANDRFVTLGGHSLAAMRVTGRVRRDLAVVVPIGALLRDPTLREFAAEVDARRASASDEPMLVAVPRGAYRRAAEGTLAGTEQG